MTTVTDLRAESDAIAARRLDAVKTLTDAERETALLRFASLAINDPTLYTEDVLRPIVVRLAAAAVIDPMGRFWDLCEAVTNLAKVHDDPGGMSDEWDANPTALTDRFIGEQCWALRALLHGGAA